MSSSTVPPMVNCDVLIWCLPFFSANQSKINSVSSPSNLIWTVIQVGHVACAMVHKVGLSSHDEFIYVFNFFLMMD